MADNYYQQQPQQGGRGFTNTGGRRGRGRGYRGRGRQQSYGARGGNRDAGRGGRSSFSEGGARTSTRGRGNVGNYYGRGTSAAAAVVVPPPPLPVQPPPGAGRGMDGGRFSTNNNINNAMTTGVEQTSVPTRGGRGSRGSGRFYDGRGRRGRGRYSSRGRGRQQQQNEWGSGRGAGDQQQQQWNDNSVTTDWAGRERDWSATTAGQGHQDYGAADTGWNNERTSSFEAQRGGTTDWAGRDREWSSNSAVSQSNVGGGQPGWQDRDRNWNNQGVSSVATDTSTYLYNDELKRKRAEQPYNAGGPPFEDKRPREAPTSSYASLGEREFRNPTPPPPVAMDEGPPQQQQQRFPGSAPTWRGRGRGRGRGSFQAKRHSGRGDFGYQTGRGQPQSHYQDMTQSQQYHDAPPVGSNTVPPGLSAYGPQPDEYGRTGPSDRPPFPQGEGSTGRSSFRRPSTEGGSSLAPPPPLPHVPPPNVGMQMQANSNNVGSSDQWNRPPPAPAPAVSTGSYASLAAENPFVTETAKEPVSAPQEAMEQESVPVPTKPLTPPPPPEPIVQRPPSPPSPVGPPSGLMVALARLADLESQLDFALAKHMQVTRERELIGEQTKHLKELPVGVEAFEEDLAKLSSSS